MERAFYTAQFEAGVLGAEAFATLETLMATIAATAQQEDASNLGQLYDRNYYAMESRVFYHSHVTATTAYEVGLAYLAAQREVSHLLHLTAFSSEDAAKDVAEQRTTMFLSRPGASIEQHAIRGLKRGSVQMQEMSTNAGAEASVHRDSLHGVQMVAFEHEDNITSMRKEQHIIVTLSNS